MQAEDNRLHVRFPFRALVSYTVLGDDFHPPREVPAEAEIIDLSECGAGIYLRDWAVKVGFLVVLRIPISETRTTVPTLAHVRCVKEGMSGVSHAGLSFLL
jgi:hypothetical protein